MPNAFAQTNAAAVAISKSAVGLNGNVNLRNQLAKGIELGDLKVTGVLLGLKRRRPQTPKRTANWQSPP